MVGGPGSTSDGLEGEERVGLSGSISRTTSQPYSVPRSAEKAGP